MQVRRRRFDRTVLAPGQVLAAQDSYHVGAVIGEGGYAVVYEATSSKGMPVALKEFVPGGTVAERDQVRDLFLRERDVLWQLRFHPHLPDLLEAFSQDGMRYLALELVPGESLRERLDGEGQISSEEVGFLSLQLTRALAALHAHGVVHHDVKPDNVKLGPTGLAVLLDLGSARAAASPDQRLQPLMHGLQGYLFGAGAATQIAGTPGYMAPELREMVEAESMFSSYALDVFALGCTIYELITKKRLPQDEIDHRNHRFTAEAVREVAERCPDLAAPLAQMLAPEPNDRYASARYLLEEMEQVIPPRPAVRRQQLEFHLPAGGGGDEQFLVITNAGGGRLSGILRSKHPALSFRRADGSIGRELPFAGNVTVVRVVANGGASGGRQEEGRIEVETDRGNLSILCQIDRETSPVRLSVTPARATLKVTKEIFQQVTLRLRNEGETQARALSEMSRPGIVEVSPEQAVVSAGADAHFRVRPVVRASHPGSYEVDVSFRTEGGETSPPVRISVEVSGGPWRDLGRRLLGPRR